MTRAVAARIRRLSERAVLGRVAHNVLSKRSPSEEANCYIWCEKRERGERSKDRERRVGRSLLRRSALSWARAQCETECVEKGQDSFLRRSVLIRAMRLA